MSYELADAQWRKSSYSDHEGECVEVADGQFADLVPVRDSKDPAGPALSFPAASFTAFVASVKAGTFDIA
ncbi:DUF397 domain-containing protein [Kitasatospora sp. NBC_01287]|uniref:DUF397 domain-containing protein n=1 Tax=Kitasatospora sp. NBC_01287 TaxID=2903573 RepID=UPI0022575FBC|nr:DUF397 domain-containing protein [Kitasatospora sp. NBC_01287]MCX4746817.1 DUF397 domain-containing protein [Kitasatospora sp. NBC_01287]